MEWKKVKWKRVIRGIRLGDDIEIVPVSQVIGVVAAVVWVETDGLQNLLLLAVVVVVELWIGVEGGRGWLGVVLLRRGGGLESAEDCRKITF